MIVPQEDIDEEHGSHSKVPSVRVSARAARRHDSDRRLFKPQDDEPEGPLAQLDLGAAEQEHSIGDAFNAAVETQGPFRYYVLILAYSNDFHVSSCTMCRVISFVIDCASGTCESSSLARR
jgi:hypothetical protein